MPGPRSRRPNYRKPPLTAERILAWADAFHAAAGRWPTRKDRRVGLTGTGETWSGLDACLKGGHRGLNAGSSLALLLRDRRGRRHHSYPPTLTVPRILEWADAHRARTGDWPGQADGPIPDAPGESWSAVEFALREGTRGLPGGSSVAQLLAAERGVRNHLALPPLVPAAVLAWADAHHSRTGDWPGQTTGPVTDAAGETWAGVDAALRVGVRGLAGGSSLAKLLARRRDRPNQKDRPPLTEAGILAWADAHRKRTGRWPTRKSGAVADADGETWPAVAAALANGRRGLPGRSSLPRLLAAERGVGDPSRHRLGDRRSVVPPLTADRIVAWAEAHFARTGAWPTRSSGPIPDVPGETWATVADAVADGRRGLPAGGSLPRLLADRCGARNHMALPPLTEAGILAWADAFHAAGGRWPERTDGPVAGSGGETWLAVEQALGDGLRGLPGGDSLARLLARHRGKRNRKALPPLTVRHIRRWARAHVARTGAWPTGRSGPVADAPGETWAAVDSALRNGGRGLPGGDSLAKQVAVLRAGP